METKVCGILCEVCHDMDDASAVVGIGINVNNTNQPCLRAVLGKKERIARTPLLLSFLVHLKRILSAFWKERQQVLLLYYQRWRHFGQTIHCVDLHNTTRTMTICGLSENANICCRSQSGTLYELSRPQLRGFCGEYDCTSCGYGNVFRGHLVKSQRRPVKSL